MKLITSLHKLPLNVFIDCICDDDYTGLIVEGKPTETELSFVWNHILEQYSDAMNDDGHKKYVIAYREYKQAEIKYNLINTYIELLNNYFKNQGVVVRKWIADLNKLVGVNYTFDESKVDGFDKYLNSCFKRNKGNLLQYNLAQARLEEITKVEGKGSEKPDRAYFTKVLVNLKKMESREIPNTISTYEFCVLVNNYKEYVDYLNKSKK